MRTHLKFLICLLLFSYFTSTSIFWAYEKGVNFQIKSFHDVLWWWVVTSTTVGYGDVIPSTPQGRIATVIAIIIGIYVYTNFVTLSADRVHQTLESKKRGLSKVKCKNHIVICEYTAFADELIQELDTYPEFKNKDVVIVSDLINSAPYSHHHFVFGVPISPDSLIKGNVQYADYIFVFANVRFKEPDLKTLHIVSRIQKLNKHATIFIELTNPEMDAIKYIKNASNKVIIMDSNRLLESVLAHNSVNLNYFINAEKLENTRLI